MYTRPRQPHEAIPSISTISPYNSSIPKTEELPNWYTAENFLRPEAFPLSPAGKPEPRDDILPRKVSPPITKPRTPHLPAEKNSAQRAARIAAECEDRGADTPHRFQCHFQGCNKYFQRRYNLKVHVRKHTKETPYTCGEIGCGKKFMWRSSISHHLKAHKKRRLGSHTNMQGDVVESEQLPAQLPPLQTVATGVSGYRNVESGMKEDGVRRQARLLPTSPISSGTNERFGSFTLEHVGLSGNGDVGMEELNFHGEQVPGMLFENML